MSTERDFGHAMRLLRKDAGMSQATLAQRLADYGISIDATAVTRMERGPRLIRLDEAAAVGAVFGLTIDGVLGVVNPEGNLNRPESSLLRLLGSRLRRMADEIDGGVEPEPASGDSLGVRIRELRQRLDLSQERVGAAMTERGFSWHQTTVYKTEAGLRPLQFGEALALAAILRVPLEVLATQDTPKVIA